ncbi:mitochondrial small ribosomal subunit Rsm22-domain-containing protein [Nemania sp. NC0429]|nr:mitochondrial small ribosomal subunit Rsm22-domain-containing protein [Nemania sp. NC0429]
MLSASRAPKPCPACRRQIRSLLDKALAPAPSEASALPRYRLATLRRPMTKSTPLLSSRCFTTTRTRSQEPPPSPAPERQPPGPGDVELVVRQARRTFGDTLPKGYLNDDEYKLYTRLYGPPLRETKPEDVGMPVRPLDYDEEEYVYVAPGDLPLREAEDGRLDQVVYDTEEEMSAAAVATSSSSSSFPFITSLSTEGIGAPAEAPAEHILPQDPPSESGLIYINAVAKNQREFDALLKLQKDFEAASLRPPEEDTEEREPRGRREEAEAEAEQEEEIDEENEWEPDDTLDPRVDRVHTFSRAGHWRTNPSSLQLPKADFVTPITKLLDRTSIGHVKEAAEKAFGGPGLPLSVATPPARRKPEQKPIAMAANHHKLSEIEADAFIATMLPAMYSSTMSVLVEIRKRLGSNWMTQLMSRGSGEGPRVLDVGTAGAGLLAWEQVLLAESDLAGEKSEKVGKKDFFSAGKRTAVVGSETLRQRVSRFLHNTTFLPRLPDYLHSGDHPDRLEGGEASLPRKQFDIIIASHQMLPISKAYGRKAMLNNLWEMLSPEGGVLIVLEKGHPQGFQAVADTRARLLDEFIVSPASDPQPELIEVKTRREREPGMIIAPCTNHKACPMYRGPGLASSRNGFCRFRQRFTRPPFLQKILGASHRNHEDVDFSFVAVQRGTLSGMEAVALPAQGGQATDLAFDGYEHAPEGPDPLSLPRNILPPIKRQGHVILDLCTPAGTLERWTVPKSFSKQAYRDARKAQWGDLWALGAKTRVRRPGPVGNATAVPNDGGVRAQEAARGRKPRVIRLDAGQGGIYRTSEAGKASPSQRRAKGGKKNRGVELMKELGLEQ